MAQVIVPAGGMRSLPRANSFFAGLKWSQLPSLALAQLDLWVIRERGNVREVISRGKKGWHRPDLGRDSNNSPVVATPELDVIYFSDHSYPGHGYQRMAMINLALSPPNTTRYAFFAAAYDPQLTGLNLQLFSQITFGVTAEISREALDITPSHGSAARTLALASLIRDETGKWFLYAVKEEERTSPENIHQVCVRFGLK